MKFPSRITLDGVVVFSRDEFKEEEHPRDPDGKFSANPSGSYKVGPNLHQVLTGFGFNKMKGLMAYEHGNGVKVAIHPPEPGKNSSNNWSSYKPGSKVKHGKGTSIVKLLHGAEAKKMAEQQQTIEKLSAMSSAAPGLLPKVDFNTLTKVGDKLGSNEGGVYQAPDGKKYYVKSVKSEGHAKNEVLAAQLYKKLGVNTLNYVNAGNDKVATEWKDPSKKSFNQFDDFQKKQVQSDFAIHAWLANWDAIGQTGDNQAVIDGKVTSVDPGGSLLYRAKGSPKGSAWNSKADEWETMRTQFPSNSAFGDMTPEQLKESAAKLNAISTADITQLVNDFGPGTPAEKQALINTLVERKKAILEKANKKAPPPEAYEVIKGKAPVPSPEQKKAIASYGGSGYGAMNDCLRYKDGCSDDPAQAAKIKHLKEYLHGCALHEDMQVTRGVSGEMAKFLLASVVEGQEFVDHAFMSTSIKKNWSWGTGQNSGVKLKIFAAKGSKGAPISHIGGHENEKEVLFQAGTRLRVKKIDRASREIECEVAGHADP